MRVYYKYLPVFCIEEQLFPFYNESNCKYKKSKKRRGVLLWDMSIFSYLSFLMPPRAIPPKRSAPPLKVSTGTFFLIPSECF